MGGTKCEPPKTVERSEEHTSELQSHLNLVCRLLLEKKKKKGRSLITAEARLRQARAHVWYDGVTIVAVVLSVCVERVMGARPPTCAVRYGIHAVNT